MGRPSKYETKVKPYLAQIKHWKEQGADNKTIAKELGIAHSTFANYINQFSELADAIKSADMQPLVEELRSSLVKKALGFNYEEKKQYVTVDDSGNTKTHTEIITRYAQPDTTAIFGALNIYDKTYIKDKAQYELRKQELELRKAIAESNNFDLDLKEQNT